MRSNHRHDRTRGMPSRSGEQGRYGGERGSSDDGQSPGRGWSEQAYRQGFRDLSQRKGPKGYVRSDERIKEDLCERLMQVEDFELEDVSIEVKDGKVTLDGSVPERTMKHRIEDVACYCMGVKEVENRMRISRDQPARSDEQGSQAGSGTATSRGKREH